MYSLTLAWTGSLLISAWVLFLAARYACLFRPSRERDSRLSFQPQARVVLCVRGDDPFLASCVRALVEQDYPCFDVKVIVDRAEDPAWPILVETLRDAPVPATIESLTERAKHRSLKVTSLLQGIADLDASCEVVAIADADVVAHRHWLRDLVQPLQDPQVSVTSGVRWYIPESSEWGTVIRYLWNSVAEVRRHWLGIAWGGSMAVRRDVFEAARDGDYWERSFTEDISLALLLRQRRQRSEIVPEVIAETRESIGLRSCLAFIARQLTCVWTYHPHRFAMALETYFAAAVILSDAYLMVAAVWDRDAAALQSAMLALLTLGGASCLAHFWVEHNVFRIVKSRGGSVWSPVGAWVKCFLAAPFMPILNAFCLLRAQLRNRVVWRGIIYRIHDRWSIEVETDEPYAQIPRSDNPLSV